MLHIDTVLSLYPDDATRLSLLSQALAHTQADLDSLRDAIDTGDRNAALQYTHRAKGTASFLGADKQALQQFDLLTRALRNTDGDLPDTAMYTDTLGQPHISEPTTGTPALPPPMPAPIRQAFNTVESLLHDLETSIQALINALEINKTCVRRE